MQKALPQWYSTVPGCIVRSKAVTGAMTWLFTNNLFAKSNHTLMISPIVQNAVQTSIRDNTGISISSLEFSLVGGGSINETYQLLINKKEKFFCKINSASRFPWMFEKEKNGLQLLASEKIIRVPEVVDSLLVNGSQVLILEWIEQGIKSNTFWKVFGEQ